MIQGWSICWQVMLTLTCRIQNFCQIKSLRYSQNPWQSLPILYIHSSRSSHIAVTNIQKVLYISLQEINPFDFIFTKMCVFNKFVVDKTCAMMVKYEYRVLVEWQLKFKLRERVVALPAYQKLMVLPEIEPQPLKWEAGYCRHILTCN